MLAIKRVQKNASNRIHAKWDASVRTAWLKTIKAIAFRLRHVNALTWGLAILMAIISRTNTTAKNSKIELISILMQNLLTFKYFGSSLCKQGCLVKQLYKCPCDWSEWTQWGKCSTLCNGTQSRYRNKKCENLRVSESRACNSSCASKCLDMDTNKEYNIGQVVEESECFVK